MPVSAIRITNMIQATAAAMPNCRKMKAFSHKYQIKTLLDSPGPPSVITRISVKFWNELTTEIIITKKSTGDSIGSVTLRNFAQ